MGMRKECPTLTLREQSRDFRNGLLLLLSVSSFYFGKILQHILNCMRQIEDFSIAAKMQPDGIEGLSKALTLQVLLANS